MNDPTTTLSSSAKEATSEDKGVVVPNVMETPEQNTIKGENAIPLEGDVVMKTIVTREWMAHRSLWLSIVALAFLLSFGLAFSGDGTAPWWMLAIINLANAIDLLALAALFGLLLAWREVRGLAQKLDSDARDVFVKKARSALLRFALPLAFVMLAAGIFLRLLPAFTA